MTEKTIAVLGAGIMGRGIAYAAAVGGFRTILQDVESAMLEKAVGEISATLEKGVALGKVDGAQAAAAHKCLTTTRELAEAARAADLVIEAVPEKMEIKQSVFAELDEVTPGHAILSSNTSSLSITEMGEATSRPHKVVGFHFFYPASTLRLIEVIEGDETSEETMQSAANFAQQIRKLPIRCGQAPGFVVNRILNSAVSEIWRVRDEEDLDVEDVDKIVQESKAAPMGPFRLADMLGLDTVLHVAEHLRDSFGDRFYVSPAMKELVDAGNYGQKTGKGFYEHG